MEQKAFDVIVEKLGEVLAKQEFKRAPDESEEACVWLSLPAKISPMPSRIR